MWAYMTGGPTNGERPETTDATAQTDSAVSTGAAVSAPLTARPSDAYYEGQSESVYIEPPRPGSTAEKIERGIHQLKFTINVSRRYHAFRRAWFLRLHRLNLIFTAITSGAAFVTILAGQSDAAQWLALAAAVLSFCDLAIRFSERATDHDETYRRYCDLLGDIEGTSVASVENVASWSKKMRAIEADEPTALDALHVHCHNLEAESQGYDDTHRHYISVEQRFLMQWFTLPWADSFPSLADRRILREKNKLSEAKN